MVRAVSSQLQMNLNDIYTKVVVTESDRQKYLVLKIIQR